MQSLACITLRVCTPSNRLDLTEPVQPHPPTTGCKSPLLSNLLLHFRLYLPYGLVFRCSEMSHSRDRRFFIDYWRIRCNRRRSRCRRRRRHRRHRCRRCRCCVVTSTLILGATTSDGRYSFPRLRSSSTNIQGVTRRDIFERSLIRIFDSCRLKSIDVCFPASSTSSAKDPSIRFIDWTIMP